MRLELAERLRCPRPHAPTPLIVLAEVVVERDLVRGVAGCATCGFEVAVVDGALRMEPATDAARATARATMRAAEDVDEAALERLQALLGLAEPEGFVLLEGRYARFARALESRCEVSALVPGAWSAIPFTDGTFRGAALDASGAGLLAEAVRCVASRGRLVAPIDVALPSGVRELARDDREWVGERDETSGVIELKRRQ